MTVFFIGAGPGDPELITVRGLRLIERCEVCLYAGSLVPEAVVAAAPEDARVIDTASLTLDDIIDEIDEAHYQSELKQFKKYSPDKDPDPEEEEYWRHETKHSIS